MDIYDKLIQGPDIIRVPLLEVFVPVEDNTVGELDTNISESFREFLLQDPDNANKVKQYLQSIIDSI
jgi:hypothetical protein